MTDSIEVWNGWSEGRLQLIVGLCEKMGVKDIFNIIWKRKWGDRQIYQLA